LQESDSVVNSREFCCGPFELFGSVLIPPSPGLWQTLVDPVLADGCPQNAYPKNKQTIKRIVVCLIFKIDTVVK
jgi:hypothetical protein